MTVSAIEKTVRGLHIGGEWTDASGGKTFEDNDPFTGDVVANTPKYNGMLYEERGRRILSHTGEKVVIDSKGQPWVVGEIPTVGDAGIQVCPLESNCICTVA